MKMLSVCTLCRGGGVVGSQEIAGEPIVPVQCFYCNGGGMVEIMWQERELWVATLPTDYRVYP